MTLQGKKLFMERKHGCFTFNLISCGKDLRISSEERITDTKRVKRMFSAGGVGEDRGVSVVYGATNLAENSKRM